MLRKITGESEKLERSLFRWMIGLDAQQSCRVCTDWQFSLGFRLTGLDVFMNGNKLLTANLLLI